MDQRTIALLFFAIMQSFSQSVISQTHIFGEGIISTGDYETHPAFSPTGDTLYFLKGFPDAGFFSICVSYKKNGKWSAPRVASFSGMYTDADPFVTRDGKTLYFVSNRPINEGEPVKPDWDIWKTELTASGWGKPIHLDSTINSSASEYFPTMADNGNLYFGSGRKGGKGRADIYVSRFIDGKYTLPENLGDSINTSDNEYEPYIAPDESYLIFMATYPNGLGNADFYISHRVNGTWSKAKKLPEPINSPVTEWGGKVTRDGKFFFFGSNRNKINDVLPGREDMKAFDLRLHSAGNGLGDIYYIEMPAVKF
ncbi:MAG: PD40 domain-containing protein [Chitinophagaceae bacterium]|nr:PD40 domain-containing protein [Chitinophagaceae bacterium]